MSNTDDVMDHLRRIDPVDGDRLAASWTDSEASQALFEEITSMPPDTVTQMPVTEPPAPTRTRRRWLTAAGIAAAALATVVVSGTVFNQSPAFAIRQLDNGVIEVDWQDEDFDGAALTKELREFGIDAQFVAVPASPSAVGQLAGLGVGEGGPIPGITTGPDGSDTALTWWIDPQVFTGPMEIHVGVAADQGQAYGFAEEVFEPGEVLGGLHCAIGESLRADDVAPFLTDLGLDVEWNVIAANDDPSIINESVVAETPDGVVMWGYALDNSTVRLSVVPDDVQLDPAFHSQRLSDVPCSPEQAASWAPQAAD